MAAKKTATPKADWRKRMKVLPVPGFVQLSDTEKSNRERLYRDHDLFVTATLNEAFAGAERVFGTCRASRGPAGTSRNIFHSSTSIHPLCRDPHLIRSHFTRKPPIMALEKMALAVGKYS